MMGQIFFWIRDIVMFLLDLMRWQSMKVRIQNKYIQQFDKESREWLLYKNTALFIGFPTAFVRKRYTSYYRNNVEMKLDIFKKLK